MWEWCLDARIVGLGRGIRMSECDCARDEYLVEDVNTLAAFSMLSQGLVWARTSEKINAMCSTGWETLNDFASMILKNYRDIIFC